MTNRKTNGRLDVHVDNQPATVILSEIYKEKERKIIMEKAFAYICAASDAAPRLLNRYCRKVYELGYVPICPKLSEAQYPVSYTHLDVYKRQNLFPHQMGFCASE